MKIAELEADLKARNVSFHRRPLPIELLNELFGSLPFENAFGVLAKMPNCFLARNVQKMINSIKMAMKENKWNLADCGRCLAISEDRLIVTKEPFQYEPTFTSLRANLPFPPNNGFVNKPKIAFSTCNGELLGKIELPPKFATLKLFPAVSIIRLGESIRANFGKEQFRFKDFKLVLEMECNTFIEEEESDGSDYYDSDYDYLSEEDENIDENDDNKN